MKQTYSHNKEFIYLRSMIGTWVFTDDMMMIPTTIILKVGTSSIQSEIYDDGCTRKITDKKAIRLIMEHLLEVASPFGVTAALFTGESVDYDTVNIIFKD